MKRAATATCLLALAFLVGPPAGAAGAACAVGQSAAYDNPADQDDDLFADSFQQVAQSFKVPSAVTLQTVTLYLKNNNLTDDSITVGVHSDTGGHPGALLGTTRTRNLTNVAFEFADFDFSADKIALAAGTTYYIVATSPASSSSEGYSWGDDKTNATYPDGRSFFTPDGTSWDSEPTFDQLFRVSGQTCTAPVQPQQPNVPVQAAASGLTFSNKIFAAESSGPSASRKRKAARGTKVGFTLNTAASVRFTVTRRIRGRKVKKGKKTVCLKPTRKNRKRKSCKRTVALKGSFSRTGVAGANSFHFSGRLRGRKLKPGRYRLVATPSAGGVKGKPTSSAFRIVR
jgi:hypothetical protein